MSEKIKAMQTPKRCLVDGHMMTVFLTDYQEDGDYYHGVAIRNRKTGAESLPVMVDVHGLRPHPYDARPDVDFQYVECGDDEQPLLDIAEGNAAHHRPTIDAGKEDRIEQLNEPEQVFDERDANKDGVVSKAERKAGKKENEGEPR